MGLRGPGAKPVRPKNKDGKKPRKRRPSWANTKLTREQRVIEFVESLKLTSGEHAGKRFKLRPWQRQIVASLYATGPDGKRVVRQAVATLARKNGKTQLLAALALNALCGSEAIPRGQVFSAASDRKQAALIMREMVAFIRADAELSSRIIIRQHEKTLTDIETGSTYEALSSDARKAHGLGGHMVVCDEVAQWHGRELYDNLLTGQGAVSEPLIVTISTMSGDPNSLMSELVSYGRQVNAGDIEDPTFCAIIYAADDGDDPWSEETWRKANPALGDFRSLEEMRVAAEQAKRMPARESSFRLLYLNQPVTDVSRFLNAADWRACAAEFEASELIGKRCILGLDLASTTDLAALCAYFPEGGELLSWFWTPEEGLEEAERRDHVPYQLWKRQGFLETTPGRTIGRDFIVQRLREIASDYNVQCLAFDRWGTKELRRLMDDIGLRLELEDHGQGFKDMTPSVAAFEIAVLDGKLKHNSNPVMNWCVANTVIQPDPAGGRKPTKEKSTGRIDGSVAGIMCVGVAARTAPKKPSVYRTRGLRVF